MGSIIFLALEILFIGAAIQVASFFSVVLITFFFLGILYFWLGQRKILYFLLPIIFLGRIFLTVNFEEIQMGELKKVQTTIVNSKGRIKKIDDRLPLIVGNIYTPKVADGKYVLYGTMEKLTGEFDYFAVETLEKEELPLNKLENLFNEKLKIMRKYISNKCGNFLQGIILGERGHIYKNVRDKFIYCGSAHLLAISGLHIGVVIGLILKIVNIFKLKREVKYILAFVALTGYVLGISVSPSVIRAYIMGVVFLLGKIFYEKLDIKKSLSVAVIINLFLFPNSIGDISFVLSYICLFTIIYIYPKCCLRKVPKNKKVKDILNFFIFTGVIQIFITPVSIYFFRSIPLFSYFTNFFVTPVGMFFVSISFMSFFVPETIFRFIFVPILEFIYKILEIILNFCYKIPYLTIKLDYKLSLKFIIFLYIILMILFYHKEIKKYLKKFFGRTDENSRERVCN